MTDTKNQNKAMSLTVTEGLTVAILPNSNYEFLMTTKEVAGGYGTSEYVIRQSKSANANELIEGKHFVKGVRNTHTLSNAQPHQIFWTKRGIVRLGFFIKSERAKLFRDWAEELVIDAIATQGATQSRALSKLSKEKMVNGIVETLQTQNTEMSRENYHLLQLLQEMLPDFDQAKAMFDEIKDL